MKKKKNALSKTNIKKLYVILPYILLTITAVLSYSNSFDCAFQFDDAQNIINQSIIKDFENYTTLERWTNINSRPLALLTFSINYHLHSLDVTGYHIFNLIIHIISGFLVFLLIKKILKVYLLSKESNSTITWMSLFVALVFLLHPIQTQSVTYIVQRMTSLSGLFYLLAVYLYFLGRIKHSQKGFSLSVFLYYLFVFVSAILSLMAKQIAVTLPLNLLLIEICFIRNKEGKIYIKYILCSFAFLVLIFLTVFFTGNLPKETTKISRLNYLITQFRVMIRYIRLVILPINQNLDHDVRASVTFWHFQEIASFLLISFLIFLGLLIYKKERLISFGIGWFFITLALESTIIPIGGLMYEHRLYLAIIGFSVCLIIIIYKLLQKHKKLVITILILIVIVYGFATFQRNKVWENRFTLWSDVQKKSPMKPRSYYNMGNILSEAGKQKKAIDNYLKAIQLKPNFVDAMINLGNSLNNIGDTEKAIMYYKNALEYKPNCTKALNILGVILSDRGELDDAKEYYEKVLKIETDNTEVLNNIGIIFAKQKKYQKAIEYFQEALRHDSKYIKALNNLGVIFSEIGELDDAKEYYEKVLDIKPDDPEVLNNLGIICVRKKEYEKSIKYFQKALSLNPNYENAKKNLKVINNVIKSNKK